MYFLTVYPNQGYEIITQKHVTEFVNQIAGFAKKERRVFIRFAPEMNGSWFVYGQQPTNFKKIWIALVKAIRAEPLCKDRVAFIWAPNFERCYPFAGGIASITNTTSPDLKALDTNNNGQLDANDDAYSPYYPGDEFVDWYIIF